MNPRSRWLPVLAFAVLLAVVPVARPQDGGKAPPRPLADLAKDLEDPDRKVRLKAAVAIRDHYQEKAVAVLPTVLAALGDVLDHIRDEPTEEQSVLNHTEHALRQVAHGTGWIQVIMRSTRHPDPRVRAAAFAAWLGPVRRRANIVVDRADLLAAIRQGLKDDSPLVRAQAAYTLAAFWDSPPKEVEEAVSLLAATLDDRTKPHEGAFSPAVMAAGALTWFEAKQTKPAIPALIKAIAAEDIRLAGSAMTDLRAIAKADESVAEDVVKVFRSTFTDKRRPETIRAFAIRGLIGLGPATRSVIPDLVKLLDDPGTPARLQWAAVAVLTDMGPPAAPAVPALVKLLERSATRWEVLQVVNGLLRIALRAARLEGRVIPWPDPRFAPRGRIMIGPHLVLGEVTWRVRGEQGRVLRALQAIGPAAAPAVEPLKRYRDKVRGHPDLEKQAYDALVAIAVGK